MYALAINGSPRKGGNTEFLLRTVLEPLAAAGWDTELVQTAGRDIRGCIACYKCFKEKDGQCHGRKDDLNPILEKAYKADAILVGSPTYFTDVSAEAKAFLDRAGLVGLASGGLLRGKIGAAVVAVRRGGGTHVYDSINHMYLMSEMLVPGSTYWNIGYGLDRGEVAKDQEALNNMRHLGRAIAWLGEAVRPHLASYPVGRGENA